MAYLYFLLIKNSHFMTVKKELLFSLLSLDMMSINIFM